MKALRSTRALAERYPTLVVVAAALVIAALVILVLLGVNATRVRGAETDNLVRVTAYCPGPCCCGRWADGRTASGTRADHPLVAAPRGVPFGTRLRIPDYAGGAPVRVEDRGGAIRGRRLDVLFPTHAEALAWGVRWLDVETQTD